MRVIAFTTSYWNDINAQDLRSDHLGLKAWYKRVTYLFKPYITFVACGTWSDPALSPLGDGVPIINAGIPSGTTYDFFRYQLCCAAITSAMAYILNRNDFDYAVYLDIDSLVGCVDFPNLFSQFGDRSEIVMSPQWCGLIGGPFIAFKREACVRMLHHRIQGNCVAENDSTNLLIGEEEQTVIMKGRWWNPWPNVEVRMDYHEPLGALEKFMESPFVRKPSNGLVEMYIAERYSKAVPLS